MSALDHIRFRGSAALAAGVGLLVAVLACATAPAPKAASGLSDVRVDTGANGTTVTLAGTGDAVARSFQEDDPARIVVDLDGVSPGTAAANTVVFDGTVDKVQVSERPDGSGTRVEIDLATVARHELVPGDGVVTVKVTPEDTAPMASSGKLEVEDPWASVAGTQTGDWQTPEEGTEDASGGLPAVSAAPATRLTGVDAHSDGQGVVVELEADGAIENLQHFALDNPTRLVIDLPGLKNEAPARTTTDTQMISRVRVGQHEDKVRVVMDAAEGVDSLGDAQFVTVPSGLAVAMGGATAPAPMATAMTGGTQATDATTAADAGAVADTGTTSDAATTADTTTEETAPVADASSAEDAPAADTASSEDAWQTAAPAAPAPAAEPAVRTVFGVQLDTTENRDRVAIVADGPLDYATVQPDPETLIVQIFGAKIDPAANVRLAPEKPGAVSMVSAFEQPEGKKPEVRVVIQRAANLTPMIDERGPMLTLDFAHGKGMAKAIPVLKPGTTTADATAKPQSAAAPASMDSPESIDVLEEGGLVDGKVYTGRRVSLDFKDVDIDDVLRLIAEVSELNVIAGDEVQGQVTIRLVDVPWDQALDVILLTKGLGFVRVGNVLRIAPADVLKAEEEARLQEKRAKEKLEDLVVKLQPVNYANVGEVAKMVRRLLTSRGTVDVDGRTNTLIMKDIASVIDEATALVKAIDTQTPQVMIEAKIVEASLDFSRELGSLWATGIQPRVDGFDPGSDLKSFSTAQSPENIGDITFRDVANPVLSGLMNANNVAVANPITALATGAVNVGAFLLDDRFNVDVQIEAAESHGEGKVISSPRIVTLDNRKATIQQGVSIPFQTFENGDAQLEFIDAVLKLEVTPHITADRSIIMVIEVKRNAPDDSVPTSTGSPAIAKNEAKTETLVKDGQTLVIGGIYTLDNSDRQSRVPYFHKIPILGNAFKNTEVSDSRKELLVFVTPRVVVNPEAGA